jgi:hypothetical protein
VVAEAFGDVVGDAVDVFDDQYSHRDASGMARDSRSRGEPQGRRS